MKWSAALFASSVAVATSMALLPGCGTAGLGLSGNGNNNGDASLDGTSRKTDGGGGDAADSSMKLGGGDSGQSGGQCVPKTCTELAVSCGPQGDGCGGLIQCGSCKAPATCGGGGMPSVCGGNNNCVPKTCPANACGPVGDGCGSEIQCGTCSGSQTCGGGGTPSVCGGTSGCVPTTCLALGFNCGAAGDGCGGLLQCGSCGTPQTCGGGGHHSVCGDGLVADAGDAGGHCVAKTCLQEGFNCGPAGDGCGNELQCGSCVGPKTCGGGGQPGVCGGNSGCIPSATCPVGQNCGPAGDGCGGEIQCGTCTAPQTCGGGGTPSVCGGNNDCVPKNCAQLGFNCGAAGDGCGGLLQCGSSCPAGQICGGGAQPGVCGPVDAGASSCTGLCNQQVACPGNNVTTTISGTVFAPNGTDPLYAALVYVPNGAAGSPTWGVTAFTPGVHCVQCGSEVSGSPLVSTLTAPDGTFQLQNVPAGANIPLVIQLGRWRRMITIPNVASCTNTALTALQTSLPSQEGVVGVNPFDNIPLMAFSTGAVDGLECVLLKIGINKNQFSNPAAQGGAGRIRFYLGEGAPGAQISATTPSATQLWAGAAPDIDQYDMAFFPCQGNEYVKTAAEQQVVVNYANAGGRIFGTHYSYVWFIAPTPNVPPANPFLATATWAVNGNITGSDPQTGYINTSFARGQALAQWLQITGASTTYAQMPVNTLRHDFNGVVAPSDLWIALGGAPPGAFTDPMHYTFDTPIGNPPATQCGRALFDDFHVEDDSNTPTGGVTFPNECPNVPMTPQEKMLEFMIFDLSSCIIPTVSTPPSCTPKTCMQEGFNCGPEGDGCGNQLDCGPCTPPQTCGGGGMPGVCGGTACTPITCISQNVACGPAGNGCGGLLQCGNCPNGTTCGGGGVAGHCGKPTCTPVTCGSQHIQCGPAGDGCGNLLECGNCPPGEACGSGGMPGICGAPDAGTCTPETCTSQNIGCGPAGNGCGGQLNCGPCPPGETCGGGGVPGQCGAPQCTPTTCMALGFSCGPAGDGCGGVLQCGPCPPNETCGGGGTPGVCGSSCMPATCKSLNFNCGPAGDGCGGLLQCGTCTTPDTCGGGGTAGQCGNSMAK
jgi:hypothetical protein